ncbi:unnamed protein product [Schistosoma spindalis]|nr:unnamed protein product [Schistosoma spindale]
MPILHACYTFLFFIFLYLEPTPPTIARLLTSTSVNFGESWPDHPRSSQRTQSIVWPRIRLAYAWSSWSLPFSSLNVVSSYVCSVFCSAPLRTQSSDPGYKPLWCGTLIRPTNIAHFSWYRSSQKTFVDNSRINDHFLFRQFFSPTIALLPIISTNQTANYQKCKPFLAGGSCSDLLLSTERD